MKKRARALACFIWIGATVFAQQPYRDATRLNELLNDPSVSLTSPKVRGEVGAILSHYVPPQVMAQLGANATDVNVISYFANGLSGSRPDPFFGDLAAAFITEPDHTKGVPTGNPLQQVTNALASAGGADVTSIVDALAQFLIKRAEQEGIDFFLDQFHAALVAYPEFGYLFHATTAFLDEESHGGIYQSIAPVLPRLFQQDLRELPYRFVTLAHIDTKALSADARARIARYADFFGANPMAFGVSLVGYLSHGIVNQTPILALLDSLDDSLQSLRQSYGEQVDPTSGKFTDVAFLSDMVSLFRVVSDSLIDSTGTWADPSAMEAALEQTDGNANLRRFYFGLLYESIVRESTVAGRVGDPLLAAVQANLTTILQPVVAQADMAGVKQAVGLVKSMLVALKKIDDAGALAQASLSGSKVSADAAAQYLSGFAGYMQDVVQFRWFAELAPEKESNLSGIVGEEADALGDIGRAGEFVADLQKSDYQDAFLAVEPLIAKAFDSAKSGMSGQQADVAAVDASVAAFMRFGLFAATLASGTKSADEIEETVEAFALPPGSYRTKFQTRVSLALDAFVGGDLTLDNRSPALALGPYAPVGISVNFSTGGTAISALSVFVGLVDVGAVAAFRISQAAAQLPSIQLQDVISPGAIAVLALGKSPFSLGLGCRIGPSLTGIADSGAQTTSDKPIQFVAFLAIDIPIVFFYTSLP